MTSSTSTTRCAACKYLRRRCPSTCILSPYFPPTDPQRFACVHKIYGASNVIKILQQVPIHQRSEAAETLYYEAYCRNKDPVYGCVGIITELNQQIHNAQSELAKIQAKIAVISSNKICFESAERHNFDNAAVATTSSFERNIDSADPFIEFDTNSMP